MYIDRQSRFLAAVSYVLSTFAGLVIYFFAARDDPFVRFHSMQAILSGLYCIVAGLLRWLSYGIPIIGWLIRIALSIALFALFLMCVVRAYRGEHFRLPIIGDWAERIAY